MIEIRMRKSWLGAAFSVIGVSLLAGVASKAHAAQAEAAAASVRPSVESLGPLRAPYEAALKESQAAGAIAAALPLPTGFVRPVGPNPLPQRLVALATDRAKRPTPKGKDGRPDLSGNWASQNALIFGTAETNAPRSLYDSVDLSLAIRAPEMRQAVLERLRPTNVPMYKPELVAKVRDLYRDRLQQDSVLKCNWLGLPRMGPPVYIAHLGTKLMFLYNDPNGSLWRIIDTTRTKMPDDADSTFGGVSLAQWQGDTLVVQSEYLPRETWLGEFGYFHGLDTKVIEKFHRTGDIITYQVTVEDPEVLAQPWTRDPITLFRTGGASDAEAIQQPCLPQPKDAANPKVTVTDKAGLYVGRLY